MTPNLFTYEDEIVESILNILDEVLQTKDYFKLCLSGGTSILKTIELFSKKRIPWNKVMIYQTDERVVSLDSEDSNYYWIKKLLGHSRAALKPFYNGYSTQKSTQSYDLYLKEGFNVKDYAFDLLLLGFGDDGHIASIFPGKENPKSEDNVLYIPEKQNGFKRLTLSLSKLKCSKTTFIISYGEKKQRVLEKGSDLPIHKFLHNQMNVIWFHKG